MNPPPLRFTAQESQAAHALWQANCGPHALAAACGRSLNEIHHVLPRFRGWMSPKHIENALEALGFSWQVEENPPEPQDGILRVQWHGPWLAPGQPPEAAWNQTHWIACQASHVHDTALTGRLAQWIPTETWQAEIENFARKNYEGYHLTHLYKITHELAD